MDVSAVVLSHGHYDHTGGLRDVLKLHGPVDVYAHSDVFSERYTIKKRRGSGIYWHWLDQGATSIRGRYVESANYAGGTGRRRVFDRCNPAVDSV